MLVDFLQTSLAESLQLMPSLLALALLPDSFKQSEWAGAGMRKSWHKACKSKQFLLECNTINLLTEESSSFCGLHDWGIFLQNPLKPSQVTLSQSRTPSCSTWGTCGSGSAGSLWRLGADADLTFSDQFIFLNSYLGAPRIGVPKNWWFINVYIYLFIYLFIYIYIYTYNGKSN